MRIRTLGWAGLEVTAAGETIVIDWVRGGSPLLNAFLPPGELVEPTAESAIGALVSHLHEDHTDVAALESILAPTARVFRPAPLGGPDEDNTFTVQRERELLTSSLTSEIVAEWQTFTIGPFSITAVPAVDGLGDPQLSWVIEAEGVRLFHGGDTLFHGYWWLIARRTGPIDLAALPVNGAVVDAPHLQPPSRLPADMTPEQAVQAATSLGATRLLPIHFGVSGWPEGYLEVENPLASARDSAAGSGLAVVALRAGEHIDLAARTSPVAG